MVFFKPNPSRQSTEETIGLVLLVAGSALAWTSRDGHLFRLLVAVLVLLVGSVFVAVALERRFGEAPELLSTMAGIYPFTWLADRFRHFWRKITRRGKPPFAI
jgi:hypothetical protein